MRSVSLGRHKFRRACLIPALLVPLFSLGLVPSASASPTCGQTVLHDLKLHADLDCSGFNGEGLIVGRGGITIDLNGFTLTGQGGSSGHVGIDNEGFNGVTVKNGTIKNYYYGVLFQYTSGSRILYIHMFADGSQDYYPIAFWYSQNGLIDHSIVNNGYYGIYLYENKNVNVTRSKSTGSEYGIYDYFSRSTLNHNKANAGYEGFYLYYPIKGYRVLNGHAHGNSDAGFYITENYPTNIQQATLIGNAASNNGNYGFYADVETLGHDNHAHDNPINCWHVHCP